MVVPAPLGVGRVVLRGVQHRLPHELAVLQHRLSVDLRVVVPVHHQRPVRGIHPVVVEIPAHLRPAAPSQLSLQLGIFPQQPVIRHQLCGEEMLRRLNVLHSRLPEQIQHIHAADVHIPQSVELVPVPEHAVHGAAGLQLVPPCLGVLPLEPVVLQDHRQDARQLSRLLPVVRLTGQHRRLRIAVHGIRVLGQDAVHQPSAGGSRVGRVAALPRLFHLLPVPQLPELLVVDDALVQILLATPVLAQDLRRAEHLLRADPRPPVPYAPSFPCCCLCGLPPFCCTVRYSAPQILLTPPQLPNRPDRRSSGSSATSRTSARTGAMGRVMQKYRLSSAT